MEIFVSLPTTTAVVASVISVQKTCVFVCTSNNGPNDKPVVPLVLDSLDVRDLLPDLHMGARLIRSKRRVEAAESHRRRSSGRSP
jgi:hypothetical protein